MTTALPTERLPSRAFMEKGRDDVTKIDVFPIKDGERLILTFEAVASPWRQGVWLGTDSYFVVNQQHSATIQLWQDTAPGVVLIECHTNSGRMHVYNIWDSGKGRNSQAWSSGMLIEELPGGRRYLCNDIGFDTDFDKLIFRIERIASAHSGHTTLR